MLNSSSLLASSNVNKMFANFEFPYKIIGRKLFLGFKWLLLLGSKNESVCVFEATITILHGADFFIKSMSKCVSKKGP